MGFFDDLAMGFGAKPKTQDFKQRTAATIARNKGGGDAGAAAAEKYLSDVGGSGLSFGNTPVGNLSNSGGQFQQPAPSSGGGYTSFSDMFDGGGPGRSGARFSSADTGAFAGPRGTYVSEAMYNAAEQNQPDAFAQTQGGIASLTNRLGFRPRGSYEQERNLGAEGTNIGTSGLGSYLGGGGIIGDYIRDGAPSSLMQVDPNVPLGARLDPEIVDLYNNERMPQRRTLLDKLNLVNKPPAAPGMEFARGGIVSLRRR